MGLPQIESFYRDFFDLGTGPRGALNTLDSMSNWMCDVLIEGGKAECQSSTIVER